MGLLDNLGQLSAGDGYVDTSSSSGGLDSSGLLQALKSLLGPTQADQKAADATANPQIIPVSDADAAKAAALSQMQGSGTGAPQGFGSTVIPQPTPPNVTLPNPTAAQPQPPVANDIQPAQVPAAPAPGINLNADGSDPGQAPAPAGGADQGGLLQSLQGASQDPQAAKGLLQSFADTAKSVGDKLTNLSPNASQALIASGLSILAGNDGRHNLAQLVGEGGIAGINNYQSNVQNQATNAIARQKLLQEAQQKQQELQIDAFKAQNAPTAVPAGESVVTPAILAGNGSPFNPGGPAVARTVEVTDKDGNVSTQGVDYQGNPVGPAQPKSLVDTGPLTGGQNTAVSGAVDAANSAKQNLTRTQQFITQLSPTVIDPATGQPAANPNFLKVPGGLAASAQNVLLGLTGGATQAQQLRQQIQQSLVQAQLQNYKAGIGGRLTNTDVNILQRGLPADNASGETLSNFLQSYGKYQEELATKAAAKSAFIQTNRGDLTPLRHDLNFAGYQFPKGSTIDQVLAGDTSGPNGQSSAPSTPTLAGAKAAPNPVAQAQAAARNGDANAQAALKSRGLSW